MSDESNEAALIAAQDVHDAIIDNPDFVPAVAPTDPNVGAEPTTSTELKATNLDETSTGQAKELTTKTFQANSTGPNAVAASNSGAGIHTAQVNPKTGLSHNVFTWFHDHVLGKVPSIIGHVSEVAEKTAAVVQESENSPAYATALKNVISSVAVLSASAGIAVAEKGVNPTQDIATVATIENVVSAFHTYINVLEAEYKSLA